MNAYIGGFQPNPLMNFLMFEQALEGGMTPYGAAGGGPGFDAIDDYAQMNGAGGVGGAGQPGMPAMGGDLQLLIELMAVSMLMRQMNGGAGGQMPFGNLGGCGCRGMNQSFGQIGPWGQQRQIAPWGQIGPGNNGDLGQFGPAPSACGPMGDRLAMTARSVAGNMSSVGWCYRGAKESIAAATGVHLQGGSAFQAANQLASSGRFREVSVSPGQLSRLPPGAVVVWGRTGASPNGHISIALGNGTEASDHIQRQITALRGAENYRVFIPSANA
jgi:hypothetical protein